jgi:hypothetical protein
MEQSGSKTNKAEPHRALFSERDLFIVSPGSPHFQRAQFIGIAYLVSHPENLFSDLKGCSPGKKSRRPCQGNLAWAPESVGEDVPKVILRRPLLRLHTGIGSEDSSARI